MPDNTTNNRAVLAGSVLTLCPGCEDATTLATSSEEIIHRHRGRHLLNAPEKSDEVDENVREWSRSVQDDYE